MGLRTFFRFGQRETRFPQTHPVPSWERSPKAYITDDGRTHLIEVPYILPKDAQEGSRLDFQHWLLKAALNKNYLAPIPAEIDSILDVGCGTGIWSREIAHAFPRARVTGIDIEPPVRIDGLRNCTFQKADILKGGLGFPDASFDFVYQRLMLAAIPAAAWPHSISQLARITKVGGWVELFEGTSTYLNAGPAMQQFIAWGKTASRRGRGIDAEVANRLHEFLRQAGLWNVKLHVLHLPIGSWGGHAGQLLATNTIAAFTTFRPLYCEQLRISPHDFDDVLATLPNEWNTSKTLFEMCCAYGQRA